MDASSRIRPSIIIRPRHGWAGIGLRELWGYHELLYFLVWRDLKVRYKQTVFGMAWAVIQPVALMIILTVFLGGISGIRPEEIPYPLFVIAGLVPWTLFAQGLIGSGNSLVDGAHLISKVYFPRLIFPMAAVGSRIVDFAIGLGLLSIVGTIYGYPPTLTWVLLVPLSLLGLGAALAVGLWLAALNVRYRDFRYVIPFLVQAWFFATPVAYGLGAVPDTLQWLVALNPMTGVVSGFRWVITGVGDQPGAVVAVSAAITLSVLVAGLAYFRRVERTFADVI